jgi:charged multivesicular body protein 4
MMDYRNIDDVDKTMDEINEQTENMKQIQEALSTPIGAAADFDEVSVSIADFNSFNSKALALEIVHKFSSAGASKIVGTFQDELEAELEELEGAELEEQLLQPATTAPAAPVQVPAGKKPVPQKRTAEEEELANLQAEMAL